MTEILKLTEDAKDYMIDICNNENKKYIHLSVVGGGCAGFSYKWNFVDSLEDNDEVSLIEDNKKLVIDNISVMYLMGMQIDYKRDIFGSILHIDNPNVTSSCGCGESFNI